MAYLAVTDISKKIFQYTYNRKFDVFVIEKYIINDHTGPNIVLKTTFGNDKIAT
ncbi:MULTISPECIES: hypothetical protein [unclassified Maribacter]|uniref:hypothetical protein n=1 Tax=unclassified Maribacter TaxID=2615042 RepID=UPI00257CC1FF|nr:MULTISPECIES: hypothetical protein [unclassified Maribacter]